MVVDAVLRVRRQRVGTEDAGGVRLVLAEERLGQRAAGTGRALEPGAGEPVVGRLERGAVALDPRPVGCLVPAPRVAEPERRQHVELGLVRAVVLDLDADEDLGRRGLGVGHVDGPVAVAVEDAGVEELELRRRLAAPGVLLDQPPVREGGLRVVVAPAQQRVARQALEVPPVLLGVLAVIALRAGEAEHPLLEDRVLAVPEREREAELVADVRESGHPVLVPAVGAGAGVVVREVAPGVAASL